MLESLIYDWNKIGAPAKPKPGATTAKAPTIKPKKAAAADPVAALPAKPKKIASSSSKGSTKTP